MYEAPANRRHHGIDSEQALAANPRTQPESGNGDTLGARISSRARTPGSSTDCEILYFSGSLLVP